VAMTSGSIVLPRAKSPDFNAIQSLATARSMRRQDPQLIGCDDMQLAIIRAILADHAGIYGVQLLGILHQHS
jgi:hypothetical protein